MRTTALLAVPVAILALLAAGCGSCDTGGQEPIEYRGGENNIIPGEPPPAVRRYQTSETFGEYLHFPAGRRYDLIHDLGMAPGAPLAFLSFERIPSETADDDNTGNFAQAAGNQFVVECIDEERVRVRNDTCAESYLRVEFVADGLATPPEEPCKPVEPK